MHDADSTYRPSYGVPRGVTLLRDLANCASLIQFKSSLNNVQSIAMVLHKVPRIFWPPATAVINPHLPVSDQEMSRRPTMDCRHCGVSLCQADEVLFYTPRPTKNKPDECHLVLKPEVAEAVSRKSLVVRPAADGRKEGASNVVATCLQCGRKVGKVLNWGPRVSKV